MPLDSDNQEVRQPANKGGGGLKMLIVIFVIVVILAVAGIAFLLLGSGSSGSGFDQPNLERQPSSLTAEPGQIVNYPPFTVNLADQGGNRYLRATLSLELSKHKGISLEVAAKEPKIKDVIISVLSSKTYDEISSTQGKIALKQEIIRRLNVILSGGSINEVYITEFVIQ